MTIDLFQQMDSDLLRSSIGGPAHRFDPSDANAFRPHKRRRGLCPAADPPARHAACADAWPTGPASPVLTAIAYSSSAPVL